MTADASVSKSSVTIEVTLDDVVPTVWRLVEVPSSTTLPELHAVIQDAMGWQDRHLHMFFTGEGPYGGGQTYEMRESLEDDDSGSGIVEDDVRVSDVLAVVGDSLGYEYDFGDGWGHRLVVKSLGSGVANPVCLDGARACPIEDSGGPHGYADKLNADASHPEYHEIQEWLGDFDPQLFDTAEANRRISARSRRQDLAADIGGLPAKVTMLLAYAPFEAHIGLADLLSRIDFDAPPVDPVVAEVAMEKLTWFLARIGSEGLKLTAAGYLPPKDIEAMRVELDWGRQWPPMGSRETSNPTVRALRAAVEELGLVEVAKGKLVLTRLGARLRDDPVGLWGRATASLPLFDEEFEKDAGIMLLVALAAGATDLERDSMMLESMILVGWMELARDHNSVAYTARPTLNFLNVIGAMPPTYGPREPIPEWGRKFALDCLSA